MVDVSRAAVGLGNIRGICPFTLHRCQEVHELCGPLRLARFGRDQEEFALCGEALFDSFALQTKLVELPMEGLCVCEHESGPYLLNDERLVKSFTLLDIGRYRARNELIKLFNARRKLLLDNGGLQQWDVPDCRCCALGALDLLCGGAGRRVAWD